MFIDSIKLDQFRNYESLELSFSPGTNILYGDNAQGKTNILEAVYLCGTTRSHRTSKDKEMIRFGQDQAHLRMILSRDDFSDQIDVHLRASKAKGIAINSVPIRKARDLMGKVYLVFFSPEDLQMIKNGPSERRKFLDVEISQMDPVYISDLSSYVRVINHRNRLLKDISFHPSLLPTLDAWDEQLVSYGKKIIEKRDLFIKDISDEVKDIHGNLTGNKEKIELVYEPNVSVEDMEEQLKKSRGKDLQTGTSVVGPHRDDVAVMVNGIDLRKYGSQGQQRTAALSLKLSEIFLIQKLKKEKPILLLDDVLSELDEKRQTYLLNSIHDIQALITCTGLDDFIQRRFSMDRIFTVHQGTVKESKFFN